MFITLTRHLAALLLLLGSWGPAIAQSAPDLNGLLAGAVRVVQAIDAGQAADLWNAASPVARQNISTDAFVTGLRPRMAMGAPQARQWVQITPVAVAPGENVAPGQYLNIEFLARYADGRAVRELVTLRLDDDQTWRLSGYTVR